MRGQGVKNLKHSDFPILDCRNYHMSSSSSASDGVTRHVGHPGGQETIGMDFVHGTDCDGILRGFLTGSTGFHKGEDGQGGPGELSQADVCVCVCVNNHVVMHCWGRSMRKVENVQMRKSRAVFRFLLRCGALSVQEHVLSIQSRADSE